MASSVTCAVRRILTKISRLQSLRTVTSSVIPIKTTISSHRHGCITTASLHTSPRRQDLNEFFDSKENWGEENVKVGRPWKPDELRLKSNTDLHKLWYVLLKERNMLMTMEEEYKRLNALFPSPERIEKVEESMENLLEVVAERDRAYHLSEEGVTGEPGERQTYDPLGREYTRRNKEQYIPFEMSGRWEERDQWQEKYLKLAEEKRRRKQDAYELRQKNRVKKLKRLFPNADIE